MSNTSATGGYLTPATQPLPGGLTLEQYFQQVIAGVTGINGKLVRPRWQQQPPKQPDIDTNWCAFGIATIPSDYSAYVVHKQKQSGEASELSTHEIYRVFCTFYGPAAITNATIMRDGLQLSQNREKLFLASMAYNYADEIIHIPELINERWVNRADINIYISREIKREYAILSLENAEGIIETDNDPQITMPYSTENVQH